MDKQCGRHLVGICVLLLFCAWISPACTTPKTSDAGPREHTSSGPDTTSPREASKETGPTENPPVEPGNPIDAPAAQWTWVDVPSSKCGYGSPTGFAINPSKATDVTRLFIYFEGGGACWDNKGGFGNCFSDKPSAASLDGYDKTTFANEKLRRAPFFSRTNAKNPFAKAHMVFIPYCSGDYYIGNATLASEDGSKSIVFNGHNNIKAFLARIAPTFHGVKEVIIAGESAGGAGAFANWWQVQMYFGPKVQVHLINDSGPPFDPYPGRFDKWKANWKPIFPPDCTRCKESFSHLVEYYMQGMIKKGAKMAFLTYENDTTIKVFLGLIGSPGFNFQERLTDFFKLMDTSSTMQYYSLQGGEHTMLHKLDTINNADGVYVGDWLKAMLETPETWTSLRK